MDPSGEPVSEQEMHDLLLLIEQEEQYAKDGYELELGQKNRHRLCLRVVLGPSAQGSVVVLTNAAAAAGDWPQAVGDHGAASNTHDDPALRG
jgi:hypothetical protein